MEKYYKGIYVTAQANVDRLILLGISNTRESLEGENIPQMKL
jgi:hypothetical protein